MWTLFRREAERRFIDRGRVACPLRGRDVEADLCAGCRWIVELREDGALPYIACRPDRGPLLAPQSE